MAWVIFLSKKMYAYTPSHTYGNLVIFFLNFSSRLHTNTS